MKFDIHNIDRRIIYLLVFLAIAIPLLLELSVKPARMKAAEKFFNLVEGLDVNASGVALLAFDFGPNTKAENEPQAEVILEHLMRRRIPVAIMTQYALAEGFLSSVPERVAKRLAREYPGEKWEYGQDWVNLGYRPGMALFIQALAKSENMLEDLGKDAYGSSLTDFEAFKSLKTLEDVKLLAEFTGLVGVFDVYVQFFQKEGYVPAFGHGCTSITIPEAYIYLDSGQLKGLLEGIAGAAWYSELLRNKYPAREADSALIANTALGVAHLVIIFLIIFGNLVALLVRRPATS
ncbi:hypothetical protein OAO01_06475 [Oligoflexia bacterium]|nr:hypothetical protein [Oligoflexia bacterium]